MVVRVKVLVLVLWLVAGAGAARAEVGGGGERGQWGRFTDFFSFAAGTPERLEQALEAYEEGRPHVALGLLAGGEKADALAPHEEEVFLLRGLVLDDLGWRDEAAEAYAAVLAVDPPSPYYPLALLRWIETRRAAGDHRAVTSGYRRWFAELWKGEGERAVAVRNRLLAYGDLRPGGPSTTATERQILASPSRLVALARDAKERPAERVVYLAGLSLFAIGAYDEAIDALERIGLSSPYYRYGLFTAAQARFAAGDAKADRPLRRLASFPLRTPADVALEERATLLEAQLRFAAQDVEGALSRLTTLGNNTYATASQLFRGELCLESGNPSLALAYYRELEGRELLEDLEARRAVGLGTAYAALGDFSSASSALRNGATRLERSRAGLEGGAEAAVEALRRTVDASLDDVAPFERRSRRRLAEGVARVAAAKGPFNLGRVVRVLFTSHANTILGQPVYDLSLLAESEVRPSERVEPGDPLWLVYIGSPHRGRVETTARRLRALGESEGAEKAWLALEATAGDAGSAWRRRRIAGDVPAPGEEELDALVARGLEALERARDDGLRRVLSDRAEGLRALQYEIEVTLSQTLGEAGDDLRSTR